MTDTLPLDDAALVARMHRSLHPGHDLTVIYCQHHKPVGVLCRDLACMELLCEIVHEATT